MLKYTAKTIDNRIGEIYSYYGWHAVIEGLFMDIKHMLIEKRDDIRAVAAKHGALNVRVFGSVARGEAGPDSDIDFLIDAGPNTSSWFPAGLILDLEEILNRRVEVVTEKALNPYIRDYVLREAIPL